MLAVTIVFALIAIFLSFASMSSGDETGSGDANKYVGHIIVDAEGPRDPWGKSVGDINGDGFTDLIVGGSRARELTWLEKIKARLKIGQAPSPSPELVWYENPLWVKHVIATGFEFSTDHEVADLDGDGRNDVVSLTKDQLVWFKNPDWSLHIIDRNVLHDIEVRDVDLDGNLDIVARNQSAFGGDGSSVFIYLRVSPDRWERHVIACPDGEGLRLGDINGDGYPDVIVNGSWFENGGGRSPQSWIEHRYTDTWTWPHTTIAVGDINKDGRDDIALAPAEKAGDIYRLSWFEAPEDVRRIWKEHVVADQLETVHHFVGAADVNCNGQLDIVTAEMHQGKDPDEIAVYLNQESGKAWRKEVIGTRGSHNMRVVDVDNDGDPDLFGANWSGEYQPVELWINTTFDWQRHVIDSEKPWRSVFVSAADIDGDGWQDIVTGGWWYKNPGKPAFKWVRKEIGSSANNMAAVHDFDGDGNLDVLASQWRDNTEWRLNERILRILHIGNHAVSVEGGFVWARNNGLGEFEILKNIEKGEGDFLQGVAVEQYTPGWFEVALSWHETGQGVQMLTIPEAPREEAWKWRMLSPVSQDEQLSAGDIDRDGDIDLLLGTKWLRNDGGSWTAFSISETNNNPDRNRLADMNQDGSIRCCGWFRGDQQALQGGLVRARCGRNCSVD